MTTRGLHKLMSGTFQRAKPGLCEKCVHRRDHGEWEGYCEARDKVLSYDSKPVKKPRCSDYKEAT